MTKLNIIILGVTEISGKLNGLGIYDLPSC